MLEINIALTSIDYESIIDVIFPYVFKNKFFLKSAQITARAALNGKSQAEKDRFVASFLNKHSNKVCEYLTQYAKALGVTANTIDIKAKSQ